MKKISILKLSLILTLIFPSFIFAQEKQSSDSAKVNQEIINKVKDRLEKTEEESTDQTQIPWYAKFGIVEKIDPSSITIKTNSKEEEIRLGPEIELSFFQQGKPTIDIDQPEIEKGWFAIALGTEISNNNNLVAKRISFSQETEVNQIKNSIVGKISEIDEESLTVKTDDREIEASLAKSYKLIIKGYPDPDFEDINIEDKIVAIITTNKDNNSNTLNAIYIIPGSNSPLSQENQIEEATPSAEATDSAEAKEATESAETEE